MHRQRFISTALTRIIGVESRLVQCFVFKFHGFLVDQSSSLHNQELWMNPNHVLESTLVKQKSAMPQAEFSGSDGETD